MPEPGRQLIILSPGFPANEQDTSCLPFPQLFVQHLQRCNPSLQVIVLAFQYPFTKQPYNWHGVHVIPFNGRNRGKVHRLFVWKAAWRTIRTLVGSGQPAGILNLWLGECGLVGKYAAKKYKLPFFTWLLGQDARKHNRYFSVIRPRAGEMLALSYALAVECNRNYGVMPAHIVQPGLNPDSFPPPAAERDIDILGVGSLIPLKRYDIFIRVIEYLVREKPALKAKICGQGPEHKRLQQMIHAAGLSDNIVLSGGLPHAEVLQLMQRSKILLHPSAYEGFATVYTEALYAGMQVVGFVQPMQHGFKKLYIVQSAEEMIAAAAKLLARTDTRYEPVLTRHIDDTCRQVLALFGMQA
jgi:glycosyltransferase involved in cell wall biosynthesis